MSSLLINFIPNIFFIMFFVMFVTMMVKIISQWTKNNNSPRLTVDATVVCKRTNVSHDHHPNAGDASGAHGYNTVSSTTYYVTFQVESGDRIEFHVKGEEYGMLAEGDFGRLSFQGTRFLNFTR